ncbi:hypothetical protein B0H13DRAFT_1930458 [Mycena leptocephala]|nr:hypothetical protein B0H13DRAFT_1930458 [Mycena leptocephala]
MLRVCIYVSALILFACFRLLVKSLPAIGFVQSKIECFLCSVSESTLLELSSEAVWLRCPAHTRIKAPRQCLSNIVISPPKSPSEASIISSTAVVHAAAWTTILNKLNNTIGSAYATKQDTLPIIQRGVVVIEKTLINLRLVVSCMGFTSQKK